MIQVISIVAYILLWIACDIGRKKESSIKLFSGKWWLQLALLTIAAAIFRHTK